MFKFDADIPVIEDGVWADYQGSRFLVAHMSNMKFQRALARHQQPYRRKIEQGSIDPQTSKDLVCKAMSEGLLLDWKDVTSKTGESVPYTPQAGYVALSKNPEFRDFISDFAMNLSNFRAEEVEDLGND